MAFDDTMIDEVWKKARAMADQDFTVWRKDECGAWLFREHYGNTASEYGWKIVNIAPGSDDSLENLRPFHLRNTFDIENRKPRCVVTADREGLAPEQTVGKPRNKEL